jgi:hypothetical protein
MPRAVVPERGRVELFLERHRGSFECEVLLHAFVHNPTLAWTPDGLSSWYGIRIDLVRRILAEMTEWGIVRWIPGRRDMYLLAEERVLAEDRELRPEPMRPRVAPFPGRGVAVYTGSPTTAWTRRLRSQGRSGSPSSRTSTTGRS